MSTGIFLGAGFSYDLGMPLAKDVTEDFFSFFNKDRLLSLADDWATHLPYGDDETINKDDLDEIIVIIESFKEQNCTNYELIFEALEGPKWNTSASYRYAYARFLDMLVHFFLIYQDKSYTIYSYITEFYKNLFTQLGNEAVWAITLNHDINLELLCIDNKIPISYGGVNERTFPLSNKNMKDTFKFSCVSRDKLHLKDMGFIQDGFGFNILKLHGALNEFNYGDSKEVLILDSNNYSSSKDYLVDVLNVHHSMKYEIDGWRTDVRMIGDIVVSDLDGELQFLRKTIKTGANKYSNTINSKKGEEEIALLDEILDDTDELIIIGYGFNDKHVNNRLLKAMYKNDDMRIYIVDPYQTNNELLDTFRYEDRVLGCSSSVIEWLHHKKNNNWEITNNEIIKTIRETRKIYNTKLRNSIFK